MAADNAAPAHSASAPDLHDNMFPSKVPELLSALRALRVSNPKATKSTVHIYPAAVYAKNPATASDRHITSWKMTEHMYFKKDNEFPTLARGLFTEPVAGDAEVPPAALDTLASGKERIVARGYDKFFNTGEMAWTSWEAIEKHSSPPYHLTLKSNGCLILISALSPTELLVASKHSLGTTTETDLKELDTKLKDVKLEAAASQGQADTPEPVSKAHAAVGREWVAKTLQHSGKTTEELAKRLWDENLTAVLELCDDSFEEHVIATPEHWTGLHLHGLNYNTPLFATKPPEDVAMFAKDFGFIPTKHVMLNSVPEVKRFTDEVAKSGSWEGDMIEGFVVRATVKDTPRTVTNPPYLPGAPFFFKVKFDEPYLMYRQWRETTRALLPLLEKISPEKEAELYRKVLNRARRQEVSVYAEWCRRKMKEAPALFKDYDRGVVRVREVFLKWIEGEGKTSWEAAKEGKFTPQSTLDAKATKAAKDAERANLPKKWILVPVAVPGCGKTTVGMALADLFGFGHTQSDDIISKKSTAGKFKVNIADLLKTKDAVYADRNNHIDKHYSELAGLADERQFAKALKPYNVRLVGIVWDITSQPYHRLLRLCSERVVERGDNHQTLRPDTTMDAEHEAVVANFLHNFTQPDASFFDKQIMVGIEDDQRTALGKVVDGLVDVMGLKRPSEEQIDRALLKAQEYKVTTPFHGITRMGKPVRYFGLAPEIDLVDVVDNALKSDNIPPAAAESAQTFITLLREKNRVTLRPHITLSHEKNVATEKDAAGEGAVPGPHEKAWDTCKALAEKGISPIYDFDVTHLAWDDRVMALVVSNIRPQTSLGDGREAGLDLVLPEEVQINLHITVGTQSEDISAFESRSVVRAAREAIGRGESTGEGGEAVLGGGPVHWVQVGPLQGTGRVRGMY